MRTIIVIALFLLQAHSICSKNVLSFEKIKFLEEKTEKQSFHLPADLVQVGITKCFLIYWFDVYFQEIPDNFIICSSQQFNQLGRVL